MISVVICPNPNIVGLYSDCLRLSQSPVSPQYPHKLIPPQAQGLDEEAFSQAVADNFKVEAVTEDIVTLAPKWALRGKTLTGI
jgi:hypothetical protein